MQNFRVSVGITILINYGRGYILLTSMEDTRKNNLTVTWLNLTLLSVTINEYGAIILNVNYHHIYMHFKLVNI